MLTDDWSVTKKSITSRVSLCVECLYGQTRRLVCLKMKEYKTVLIRSRVAIIHEISAVNMMEIYLWMVIVALNFLFLEHWKWWGVCFERNIKPIGKEYSTSRIRWKSVVYIQLKGPLWRFSQPQCEELDLLSLFLSTKYVDLIHQRTSFESKRGGPCKYYVFLKEHGHG